MFYFEAQITHNLTKPQYLLHRDIKYIKMIILIHI